MKFSVTYRLDDFYRGNLLTYRTKRQRWIMPGVGLGYLVLAAIAHFGTPGKPENAVIFAVAGVLFIGYQYTILRWINWRVNRNSSMLRSPVEFDIGRSGIRISSVTAESTVSWAAFKRPLISRGLLVLPLSGSRSIYVFPRRCFEDEAWKELGLQLGAYAGPDHAVGGELIIEADMLGDDMPTERERKQVDALENKLDEILEERGLEEVDGNLFGGGKADLYVYGESADELLEAVSPTLEKSALKPFLIRMRFDVRAGEAAWEKSFWIGKEQDVPYAPDVADPTNVGTYCGEAFSGGGMFWDDVLEYRVWRKPIGEDAGYSAFATYAEALAHSMETERAEMPLALVYQERHVDEPEPGRFELVTEPRIAEWRIEWLEGNRGSVERSTKFMSAFTK